jgi:hypothetical protein
MSKKPNKFLIDVEDEDADSGFTLIPASDVFGWLLQKSGLTNKELHERLYNMGFKISQPNLIAMWKKGDSKLPLERLPVICDALGLGKKEKGFWIHKFLCAYLPTLTSHFYDPVQGSAARSKAKFLSDHHARKRAEMDKISGTNVL